MPVSEVRTCLQYRPAVRCCLIRQPWSSAESTGPANVTVTVLAYRSSTFYGTVQREQAAGGVNDIMAGQVHSCSASVALVRLAVKLAELPM
eukprot:636284-Hanusia_phi.AAC.1